MVLKTIWVCDCQPGTAEFVVENSALSRRICRASFKEFLCRQMDLSDGPYLRRFSCCSFALLRRILSKPCRFFKVLPLDEAFPFTTNSSFCLPLFLGNIAVNTGSASNPLLLRGFILLHASSFRILTSPWAACGKYSITFIAYIFLLSSDSPPPVYKHALISLVMIIFPFLSSYYFCSLFLLPYFSKKKKKVQVNLIISYFLLTNVIYFYA